MSNASDFIIENGVLKKYVGPGGDVVIPEGIVSIGYEAFARCENVSNVIIPSGVKEICDQAFAFCKGLTSIEVPDGVEKIGWQAFCGCRSLARVTIPDSVWWIKAETFRSCEGLKDENGFVIVKDTVYDYYGPGGDIVIPEGATKIGQGAFSMCSNVTGINIPNTIETIARSAFHRCSGLTSIHIPLGVVYLEQRVFGWCESLVCVSIPETVTSIGAHAFEHCNRLSRVEILSRQIGEESNLVFCGLPEFTQIVAPFLSLDTYTDKVAKRSAALGFLNNPEKYTDPVIAAAYRKYATAQRKRLLPVIFAHDMAQALAFYTSNCKITADSFETEYLAPATNAKAVGCMAHLVEWSGTHLSKK